MGKYGHGDGCFCEYCMAVDRVRELQKSLVKAKQSLEALRNAERPTPADMAQEITARSGDERP